MRFLTITFRRLGCFDDLTLDVSQGSHGLHLIYGPNEAGKTTALRALNYLLFGFPARKCDDFRYGAAEQRIGARIRDGYGAEFECVRRRARTNSLRAADDATPLADDKLQSVLGGISQEQFAMLFGLNHQHLMDGGQEILEGKGGLGEALFAAGTGLTGLRRIDQCLSQRIDDLYKPRGQNQGISLALRQTLQAKQDLKSKILHLDTWTAQRDVYGAAIKRKQTLEEERLQNRKEFDRLQSYRSALPNVTRLHELEKRLEPLQNARLLDANFAEQHRKVSGELGAARLKQQQARAEVSRLENELELKPLDHVVLAEHAAIERVQNEFPVIHKAQRDRVDIHARMREHEGNARVILQTYFSRERLEETHSLFVSPAAEELIRDLGQQHSACLLAVEEAQARLEQIDREICDAELILQSAPKSADTSALESLLQGILAQGPMEHRESECADELAQGRIKVERELQRLAPIWSGTLEEASNLIPPSPERVQTIQQLLDSRQDARRDSEESLEACEATIRERTREINQLMRSGHVPTESDLADNRADRDSGVGLVAKALRQEELDPALRDAFVARHAPEGDLANALENGIRTCDDLSDQMRREANRASQLSLLEAGRSGAEQERDVLQNKRSTQNEELQQLQRQWQEELQRAGLGVAIPAEVMGWLQILSRVNEQSTNLKIVQGRLQRHRQQLEDAKVRLRTALQIADAEPPLPLDELMEIARKRLDSAREHGRVRDELASLQRRREREANNVLKAQRRLQDWKSEWGNAIRVIGLSVDDQPATASLYLTQLGEMRRQMREADTIRLRINGIDRDRDGFLSSLSALKGRVEGEAVSDSTIDTAQVDVDGLVARLSRAREVQTERKILEAQIGRARQAVDETTGIIAQLDAQLAALREEAGVVDENDISTAIQQSDERRRLLSQLEEQRATLHELARGEELETFVPAALASRSILDSRIAELQSRADPLDREISEQDDLAGGVRRQLNDWQKAGIEAAECRQTVESLVALIHDKVSEYAALHLSRQMLRLAIDRFRERNQGPMLGRAQHFFTLLTQGAFSALEVDEDERGQPALFAIRATPSERVEMDGLSDGTRDQLFLALRLAGIEQHLKDREPMPLIVDDILINFDADRAKATLACLAELSRQTQVLVFTHHAYLLDLAKHSITDDVLFCHNLATSSSRSTITASSLEDRSLETADVAS